MVGSVKTFLLRVVLYITLWNKTESFINHRSAIPENVYSIQESSWVVRIKANTRLCSGAVVSPTWALTALDCVLNINKSDIKVITGIEFLNDSVKYLNVERLVMHSLRHKEKIYRYAVAALKVENFGNLSILRFPNTPYRFTACVHYGWGKRFFEEKSNNVSLRKTFMRIKQDKLHCSCFPESERQILLCSEITKNNICDFGDIGGPLVCEGKFMGIAVEFYNGDCYLDSFSRVPTYCGDQGRVVFSYLCPQLTWLYTFITDTERDLQCNNANCLHFLKILIIITISIS